MRVCCLAILACSIVAAPARAQERGAPPAGTPTAAHQNLQVLSKDIPQPELVQIMQGFAQGLGVQCTYCHAPAPAPEGGGRFGGGGGRGRGGAAALDFPSDQLPAKKKARERCATSIRGFRRPCPSLPTPRRASAARPVTAASRFRSPSGTSSTRRPPKKARRPQSRNTKSCASRTSGRARTISARAVSSRSPSAPRRKRRPTPLPGCS